ncbi:S-adenosylmethionine decarboxylase proenzyme, partial [Bacillus haynesii]|nr:S-adenosylmethionine decarboxylase proenzyme [Bacillus haynesii]
TGENIEIPRGMGPVQVKQANGKAQAL